MDSGAHSPRVVGQGASPSPRKDIEATPDSPKQQSPRSGGLQGIGGSPNRTAPGKTRH